MEGLAWRTDAELVQDVRRGDHEAFGHLVDRWFDEVMAEARAVVGESEAAAEVATDTFHALWHHLDQLADEASFGAWAVDTSRAFAGARAAALPDLPRAERERHLVPLLLDPFQLRAVVDHGLQLRGVPTALAHGSRAAALVGQAGNAAGEATAVMQVIGTAGPAPAGTAGPLHPQAGGVASSIQSAGAAGRPVELLDEIRRVPQERAHRWEAPSRREGRGLNLAPPRVAAGAVAAVALLIIALVLWFTNRTDSAVASSGELPASTTSTPAAPSTTLATAPVEPSTTLPPPTDPTTASTEPAGPSTSSGPVRSTNPPASTTTTRPATTTTAPSSTTTTTTAVTRTTATSTTRVTVTTVTTTSTTVKGGGTTASTTTTRAGVATVPSAVVAGPAGTATLG